MNYKPDLIVFNDYRTIKHHTTQRFCLLHSVQVFGNQILKKYLPLQTVKQIQHQNFKKFHLLMIYHTN